jgi:hypothetical protein
VQPGTPVVGMVSVLRSWKGHDTFFDSIRILRDQTPSLPVSEPRFNVLLKKLIPIRETLQSTLPARSLARWESLTFADCSPMMTWLNSIPRL